MLHNTVPQLTKEDVIADFLDDYTDRLLARRAGKVGGLLLPE